MIRINLLAVEREGASRRSRPSTVGQKMTIGCALILLLAGGWSSAGATGRSNSEGEAARRARSPPRSRKRRGCTRSSLQVQQFEQRKAQLQQRVALIEQLRKGQTGPVHMLDQISRALPPMLWLTELKQTATPNEVTDRRTFAVADRAVRLRRQSGASGYFQRSVDIVSSTTEHERRSAGRDRSSFKSRRSVQGGPAMPAPSRRPPTPRTRSGQLKPKG